MKERKVGREWIQTLFRNFGVQGSRKKRADSSKGVWLWGRKMVLNVYRMMEWISWEGKIDEKWWGEIAGDKQPTMMVVVGVSSWVLCKQMPKQNLACQIFIREQYLWKEGGRKRDWTEEEAQVWIRPGKSSACPLRSFGVSTALQSVLPGWAFILQPCSVTACKLL